MTKGTSKIEEKKRKKIKRTKYPRTQEVWGNYRKFNISIMGMPEREQTKKYLK